MDNGQNNPFLEVPGLDYARLTWLPSGDFTGQVIANVGQGQLQSRRTFKDVYAAKFDWVGTGRYASLILSQRNSDPVKLGGYLGWNFSDALLGHAEGDVTDEGDARILAGGSYTFSGGSSIAIEYYHNGAGCSKASIAICFTQADSAEPGALTLFRRNYGFAQYADTELLDGSLSLIVRGTVAIDDGSSAVTGIASYEINDFVEIFGVADWYGGGSDDELSALLNSSVMAGVRVSY